MPLHLPPLSRRQFLASAAAAGTGILTRKTAAAIEQEADPHRWVVTADTHIAADRAKIHNHVNLAEHLSCVVSAQPCKRFGKWSRTETNHSPPLLL